MALINNDNKTWAEPGKEEFKTWNIFEKNECRSIQVLRATWIDYLKTIEEIENWNIEIGGIEHNEGRNI